MVIIVEWDTNMHQGSGRPHLDLILMIGYIVMRGLTEAKKVFWMSIFGVIGMRNGLSETLRPVVV